MPIRLDEAKLEEQGRPAAIALAVHMLRLMEEWRRRVDDYDCVMIMVAVIAILGERLLRTGVEAGYGRLSTPLDPALLPRCNIMSIAHATGLNRESARRKVNDLIERGLLTRLADRSVTFSEGLIQQQPIREMVRRQLLDTVTLANRLEQLGIFAPA